MKRLISIFLFLFFFSFFTCRISAEQLSAPPVTGNAAEWMPSESDSLANGLLHMLQKALPFFYNELQKSLRTGIAVFSCVILVTILKSTGNSISPIEMAGSICVSTLLFRDTQTMLGLSVAAIQELTEYAKLYLPVLTAASAAQGAFTASTALYLGTTVFTTFISNVLRSVLIPSIYFFLGASIACCAIGAGALKEIKENFKKFAAWFLKTAITLFMAYMGITGVISGTTDKAAVRAAKTAISAVVPVIGSTLADASETLLISASMLKNTLGLYGVFAFIAIFLMPFSRIGVQYLILKATAALCAVSDTKRLTDLISDFCSAMGLLVAMAGTICILLLIGTLCFLKGAG